MIKDDQSNKDALKKLALSELNNESRYQRTGYHAQFIEIEQKLENQTELLNNCNRTRKNPKIAGDAIERIFSDFLELQLPNGYQVIKNAMPEVKPNFLLREADILIVKDYPRGSATNYVNTSFIVAAFEVKKNLTKKDLIDTMEKSKNYRESGAWKNERNKLSGNLVYGLLAASSSLTKPKRSNCFEKRESELNKCLKEIKSFDFEYPDECIDLILVADAFSLSCTRSVNYSEMFPNDFPDIEAYYSTYINGRNLTEEEVSGPYLHCLAPNNSVVANLTYNMANKLSSNGNPQFENLEKSLITYAHMVSIGSHKWDIDVMDNEEE